VYADMRWWAEIRTQVLREGGALTYKGAQKKQTTAYERHRRDACATDTGETPALLTQARRLRY